MKVLWITTNFYPAIGGIQVYTDKLTDALSKWCSIGLVTESNQSPSSNKSISHFPIVNIRAPGTGQAFSSVGSQLSDICRNFGPQLVHFANAGVAVYRDAIDLSIPGVVTVHGNDLTAPWQQVPNCDIKTAIVSSLNSVTRIVAVSQHTRRLLADYSITTSIDVMTHGCDLSLFHPMAPDASLIRKQLRIPEMRPILLTVARFVPRKGHRIILKALRQLQTEVHWIVVGKGPSFISFAEEVRSAGLESRISALRDVTNDQLCLLYNMCDIFVLTPEELTIDGRLDSEGFGLVFHEAGACGKPVICSNISGCKEAVINGTTGITVPPSDPNALACAIDQLIMNPTLARSLGNKGALHVKQLGGWHRLAEQTYDLYCSLLSH